MGNPLRVAARVLTGSTYAVLGVDAAREPGGRVEMAGSTLATLRSVVPLPEDDELLVRANGAVQAIAGLTLALGRLPRLSALALIGSLAPTTVAGHPFWNVEDPVARKLQRVQFQKNAAMIGGLLFALLDRPGHKTSENEPSGRWFRRSKSEQLVVADRGRSAEPAVRSRNRVVRLGR